MLKRCSWMITFVLSIAVLLNGCNSMSDAEREKILAEMKHDMEISGVSSSIGAEDNSIIDRQIITYSIYLHNYDIKDKYIKWVEPVYGDEFSKRVIDKVDKIITEKEIEANSSMELNFKIKFNAEGLTKQDILNLDPYVTDIRIVSESIIGLK